MAPASTSRSPAAGSPVRDSLKSERVVAELERQILDGSLAPGDRLPTEGELCDILNVSRSVVRDAIRTLVARGLITVRQGHGTTVSYPDDSNLAHALLLIVARSDLTIGQLLDARKALDLALLPLLVEGGRTEDWDELDSLVERFGEAVDAGNWEEASERHLAFHVRLMQSLHQPALELFLKPMQEIIVASASPPRISQPEDWEVSSHPPLVAALRAGDLPAAEAAIEQHYDISRSDRYGDFRERPVREVFKSHPWSRR
jgi:GntR family transcriptional repressor for pyruvate dehydrogenase complex